MRYLSTRGIGDEIVTFEKALLEGLARDGGLFIPVSYTHLTLPTIDSV